MKSNCECCPHALSDKSEYVQGLGCLPTPYETVQMRIKHGKTWACHANVDKPCIGTIDELKRIGQDFKVIDPHLVTVNNISEVFPNGLK